VAVVLKALRRAGLKATPRKCEIGQRELRNLGYHLDGGQVRPQVEKTEAIAACSQPETQSR